MKLNFTHLIFLLIITIPFFLLKSENSKTDVVDFVESKNRIYQKDTIKLFELIDGKEEEYFIGFNIFSRNEAYFYKDTIDIELNAGMYGGYNLSIQIVDKNFTSKLTNYDCTWQEDLKIIKQDLKLENLDLTDNGKIKGIVYCEAKYNSKRFREIIENVKIEGYFEMDLVDMNNVQRFN